jgi:hypothetical protein
MESAWPVSGSILITNDIAYFAAGRNSFLDGGIFMFGLDPLTGDVVHQKRLDGPYSEDKGFPIILDRSWSGGAQIRGCKSDIMLSDDEFLYMRHEAFRPDLSQVDPTTLKSPHLITSHGFIDSAPHHRSYWTIDTFIRYDIPTGSGPVCGDILVKDGDFFYEVRGYHPGRTRAFDPRIRGYALYAGRIAPLEESTEQQDTENTKRRRLKRPFTARRQWEASIPFTGKAIAKAADVVFVAGTPAVFPEHDLAQAYEGRLGGLVWAASATDGKKLAEYKLESPPVWDSLAAANGRLYFCTADGRVHCFRGN